MTTLGDQLLNVDVGDFVRFAGDDRVAGEWHTNDHVLVSGDAVGAAQAFAAVMDGGPAGDGTRHGFVFQEANPVENTWLTIVVTEDDDGGTVEGVYLMPSLDEEIAEIDAEFALESIGQSAEDVAG